MKIIDSEYLLQVCSLYVLVTSKWTVTYSVSKLREMAIKDDFYVIFRIVKAILLIHYCFLDISSPQKHAHVIFPQKYNLFQMP